jgi:hypothetical protein
VEHPRHLLDEPAHGLVRPGRPARRRGDDDARAVPVDHRVVVYHAAECGLCERALEVVSEARAELGFSLELVDIGGDDALEARYRSLLPVVEIDGRQAFTYFVDPDALRERLAVPPAKCEGP